MHDFLLRRLSGDATEGGDSFAKVNFQNCVRTLLRVGIEFPRAAHLALYDKTRNDLPTVLVSYRARFLYLRARFRRFVRSPPG